MSDRMRRLSLSLGALSWGPRLKILAVLLVVSFQAWIDIRHGIWPVTVAIVLLAWFLGWLLMPLMVAYPTPAYKIWNSTSFFFLIVYLLARDEWWWRTIAAHFGRELVMWLYLGCGYWFLSELRLRQENPVKDRPSEPDEFPAIDSENRW